MPEVGFKFKGREYTVDRPCQFDSYCTPTDFDQWAAHTGEWVAALAKKAISGEQYDKYHRIAQQYAELVKRNQKCRITCTSGTKALVTMAQHSKMLAESWATPIEDDEIDSDWGWIGTIGLPMLPGVGDLEEMIKRAYITRLLPLAVIAALILFSGDERKQRT